MKKAIIPSEISWLKFNARVLQEASDPSVPLKARVRFLGIYSNNRDEFFRVRVSALKRIIQLKEKKNPASIRKNPQAVLNKIQQMVMKQQNDFNQIWKDIINELKKKKIFLRDEKHLNAEQKRFVKKFFDDEVCSTIIPLFIENMEKLPSLWDKSIFLGVVMSNNHQQLDQKYAIIEIPTKSLNRFVILPSAPGEQSIILLEDVIRFNLSTIFSHLGYTHFDTHMFKVTKDAEIDVDQATTANYVKQIEEGIKNRRKARTIRFLYDKNMDAGLLEVLMQKLSLSNRDSIIPGGRIRNMRDFMEFPARLPSLETRREPFKHPELAKSLRVSDVVLNQDVLLHFPYHSFNSVIDLLREAAMDPHVKSIKITAYRLASNSRICNALVNAVRNGKQVSVVLELRASFDEEANLEWKTKLEEEGVKVFLGIPNLKVHAKICVIKKKVGNHICQYGFISTGNLNEKTAVSYVDHCLLTSNRFILADINRIFKALEKPSTYLTQLRLCKTLLVCPLNMRKALIAMINEEIHAAREGEHAQIIVNVNSLSDEKLINKLYEAADAGVDIQLIIRGIFCAGVYKENWKAISIVDEYLEHSRIWLFHNRGEDNLFISSADWMLRNLDHRIEVAVPIVDETIKEELKHLLRIKLSDNVKARKLNPELSNEYVSSKGKKRVRSQIAIYDYLRNKYKKEGDQV